jgi:hypothetical protein
MVEKTRPVVEPEDFLVLAAGTLMGDLRDFVLDRLKHEHNPLPWQMRPEADQVETIRSVESAMRTWVHRAVTLIAAQGQKAARGQLIKFQAKDGIQMQINLAASEPLRHDLMDNVGATVLITIADVEEFQGERSPVKINKDQKNMLDEPPEEMAAG